MAQDVVHARETRTSAVLSARAAALMKSARASIRTESSRLGLCESLKHTSCGPIHRLPTQCSLIPNYSLCPNTLFVKVHFT